MNSAAADRSGVHLAFDAAALGPLCDAGFVQVRYVTDGPPGLTLR